MASSVKKKTYMIAGLVLIIALIAIFTTLFLRARGFFSTADLPEPAWDMPGSSANLDDDWVADREISEKLEARILELCKTEYGLVSWYRLPVRSESMPSEKSNRLNASDQLIYGRYLVEQQRMDDFVSWQKLFVSSFVNGEAVAEFIEIDDSNNLVHAPGSWTVELDYAGVLMSAYQAKPQLSLWNEIIFWSDRLIEEFTDDGPAPDIELAIPTAAPAPDPAATPTPAPLITPEPTPAPIQSLVKLSSIRLNTIKQLSEVDARWQLVYEEWLSKVSNGLISHQIPMYALAIWPESDNYLNFIGDSGAVDSAESAASLLNLAEAGHVNQYALRWVTDQLLNGFAIYSSYNIVQGHAMTELENPSVYALTARLARVTKDKQLYNRSVDLLVWHTANVQRSEALDAIFRQDENGFITVVSEDNLLALLAYN